MDDVRPASPPPEPERAEDVSPPSPSAVIGTSLTGAVVSEEARRQDLDVIGPCDRCGAPNAILRRRGGSWACGSCGAVIQGEPQVQQQQPPPEPTLPIAPRSHIARGFRPPESTPAIAGGEE